MSLDTSKTCLTNLISQSCGDFALLNFDSLDWLSKIQSVSSFRQLFFRISELNSISSDLIELIPSTVGCDSVSAPEIRYYMNNAQSFLDLDTQSSIGQIPSLTIPSDSLVESVNLVVSKIGVSARVFKPLTTPVTTDLISAINSVNKAETDPVTTGQIGTLSSLATTEKSTVVAAINEVKFTTAIKNYAFSLGLCSLSGALLALPGSPLGSTYSPQDALSADLANVHVISTSIATTASTICSARLQCIMKPGGSAYCLKDTQANVASDPACAGFSVSAICDKTWFCNLNRLRLFASGDTGDTSDDGDAFAIYAAAEIC